MAVERHGRLHAQSVASAQAAGDDFRARPGRQDFVPQAHGVFGRDVDFPAVFAGVAGAGDARGRAGEMTVDEMVTLDRRQVNVGEFLYDAGGERSLDGELGEARAGVFDGGVETIVGDDVFVILILIGGVDAQEVVIVGDFVDQDVVDETAVSIEQRRILGLAELEFRRVVDGDVLHQIERLRAAHFDLAHVADVEQSHALAHGAMLVEDACVFDGHVPAAEVDHLGAYGTMDGVERSLEQSHAAYLITGRIMSKRSLMRL